MIDELTYYSTPGLRTDPGRYGYLLDGLPDDIPALCRMIQGVMIHVFWADRYGIPRAEIRQDETQLRTLEKRLARILELDPRPLSEPRDPSLRVVGNCRDYSQLLTGILRHKGVPARARCGFGRYFEPNHFEDHWVVQYWNETDQRWVWVDPQLDPLQCQALQLRWDPADMPPDQFVTGGRAWQLGSSGVTDRTALAFSICTACGSSAATCCATWPR